MPELPEVYTLVNSLQKNLLKEKITKINVFYSKIIKTDLKEFKEKLPLSTIIDIKRKGKNIIIQLDNDYYLIIHLKMTGKLQIFKHENIPHKKNIHEHIQFFLNNKILSYFDTRKFGTMHLTKDIFSTLKNVGMDCLDPHFTVNYLSQKIRKSKKMIKAFLLDQKNLAGLGNIYVDEALFLAKIHPETISCSLNCQDIEMLYNGIQTSLKQGIKNKGTSLGVHTFNFSDGNNIYGKNQFFLNVYNKEGCLCSICQKYKIIKKQINQRSSHFCPNCQEKK